MKTPMNLMRCAVGALLALLWMAPASSQMAQSPMVVRQPEPPLVMLTVGRDEKLYYAAYNDYSDVDGDGTFDVGYKPGVISYYGLFDSNLCYDYVVANSRFEPRSAVVDATKKTCGNSVAWSGDFLNYITSSRFDTLRRVFYGGKRVVDTATTTVLERAYIPQDSHTWGKEYNAVRDSYKISDYTPFSQPSGNTLQHMFGNVTINGGTNPLMRVLLNRQERIFNWVSKEGPVLNNSINAGPDGLGGGTVTPTDYVVRVLTCVKSTAFPMSSDCKGYPAANPTVWKPTGILHDYGENRSVAFGLLTGSYDNARAGGVVRSNIGYFDNEVDANTGQFKSTVNGIVGTLDKIRVAQWAGGPNYGSYQCTGATCKDYGSPIAEMVYEGVRYFGGAGTPTPAYSYNSTLSSSTDVALGLPYVGTASNPWLDPYRGKANGGFAYCSKPVQMIISDLSPSFDSDDLPGSPFGSFTAPSTPASLAGLNVASLGQSIWNTEALGSQRYFIGHSLANTGNVYDQAPTAKLANSFGTIRGLAPGEPTRQGSYNVAAVAKFAAENNITSVRSQPIETYSVALSPSLPTIKIPTNKGTVSMIPFSKSVGGCNYGEFVAGTTFLTDRIAGFFFNGVYNMPGFPYDATINGGRAYGNFRVSFEDNEQGTDNDMDAITSYTFMVNADDSIQIDLKSEYASGCIDQSMGFVISGTTTDGAFLGVRDIGGAGVVYALNDSDYTYDSVNASGQPIFPKDGKLRLKYRRTFIPVASSGGSIPHDPLWYAAKYGVPSSSGAWDSNKPGVPNNYALVTDPSKLKKQLSAALDRIASTSQPSASVSASGALVRSGVSLGFSGRYAYGKTSIPRVTGNPITATIWEGYLDAIKINDNGTLGATVWSTKNANFTSSRVAVTKINGDYRPFTAANLATDATLTSTLAPGSLQSLMEPILTYKYGALTSTQLRQRTAEATMNYLLGDQSLEQGNTPTGSPDGPLRPRLTIMGDIVHSLPVYQGAQDYGYSTAGIPGSGSYAAFVNSQKRGKPALVWVGANDGMLHAIDASNGDVKWSFIPTALQSKLEALTRPSYTHQYYMNGQIAVGDIYTGTEWRTMLVAAAGAGAKTVVGIDVTDRQNPQVKWELVADDLGYVLGNLAIVKLSTAASSAGKWAIVFGNGYETAVPVSGGGTKQVARLFVLDAYTGTPLGTASNLTVPDTVAYNGMGTPALLGQSSVASAWVGDLGGNLWRFDLSGAPSAWGLALPGKAPLFKAERTNGSGTVLPQPITAAPSVSKSFSRGYWITFGTGKFFQDNDRTSTDVQSIYSVRDLATDFQLANNTSDLSAYYNLRRSKLTPYTLKASTSADSTKYREVVAGTSPSGALGWYLDLTTSGVADKGERVLTTPVVYLPSVFTGTFIPSGDPCSSGSDGWFMAQDLTGGGQSETFDTNENGVIGGTDTKQAGQKVGGFETTFGLLANSDGSTMSFLGLPNQSRSLTSSTPSATSASWKGGVGVRSINRGRTSWRQIQ